MAALMIVGAAASMFGLLVLAKPGAAHRAQRRPGCGYPRPTR
jgi:hypothetical protein